MSALKWIYDNRVDSYGLRVRRFGSRKFGLVANVMTGDPYLSSSAMGTSWRLHFGYGPFGGVDAGLGLGWGPR
jgi:hypothetical protein